MVVREEAELYHLITCLCDCFRQLKIVKDTLVSVDHSLWAACIACVQARDGIQKLKQP